MAGSNSGIDNKKVSFRVGQGVPSNPPAGSINMDEASGAVYVAGSTKTIQLKDTTKAPISHASSGTTYGVSTASNYGHAKASSTSPKGNGTAAVGSETSSFARGDHVHPLQTTVSGNAGTATKLATARTINGTAFDGSANITTANWGTTRNFKIGDQTLSVNGSANINFNKATMGVASGWNISKYNITKAGWYRIAQSDAGIGNLLGIFTVSASASGVHSVATFEAGTCYGVTAGTTISQLAFTNYSSDNITKARIVYHTTYRNNYAYVEVYINTSVSTTLDVRLSSAIGWLMPTSITEGSVPTGYTSKELNFVTGSFVGNLFGSATSLAGGMTYNSSAMIATDKVAVFDGNAIRPMTVDNMKSNLIGNATTSAAGLMTAAMVTKLNGIAAGANAYSLPLASSSTRGGVKIGYTQSGKNYPVQLSNEKMYVNVPWTDNNTWIAFKGATASSAGTAGYVPAPASGQTGLFFKSDGTWAIPTNTQYSNMTGATASAAGKAGLVPAPAAGKQTSFLRGDGTWVIPTDTNTHYTANLITSDSATGTTQYADEEPTTNVFLNLVENSTVRNSHKIVGSGIVSVSTNSAGQINVKGPSIVSSTGAGKFPIYFAADSTPGSLSNLYILYSSTVTLQPSTGTLDGVIIDGGSID